MTRLVNGKEIPLWAKPLRVSLIALSWIHSLIVVARNFCYDKGIFRAHKVGIPVISVGNLSCGGTGKTPFVMWLARKLIENGQSPVVLSRGYGKAKGMELNEEALMLQKNGIAVMCNADRVAAAKEIELAGEYSCIILDDGFQHRRLQRNMDIVLIDSTVPPWNDSLLPAGFLRESLGSLKRANTIILTRTDLVGNSDEVIGRIKENFSKLPVFASQFKPLNFTDPASGEILSISKVKGKGVAAFCGLGNPSQFFESIEKCGAKILWCEEFPDHHNYTAQDIKRIEESAESASAEYIITSTKDWVKCEPIDRFRKYLIFHVGFESPCEQQLLQEVLLTWS